MNTITTEPPPAPPDDVDVERADDGSGGSNVAIVAWVAVIVAIGAVLLAAFAFTDDGDGAGAVEGGGPALSIVDVELGSMTISPSTIEIEPGTALQLRVTNVDSQVHNLEVLGATTPDLQPGDTYVLDVGVVRNEGTYQVLCNIPGHAAAGMTAELVVGTASGEVMDAGHSGEESNYLHGYDSWEEMEASMTDRAMQFLDPEIKGVQGGQTLEPEILADGTKRYELTAEIVDWEVEPGLIVQAWTYNGVVPAPEIRVEVGDRVQVELTNDLPTATTIHWHGVRVPNEMDGVPPYTQTAVAPGEVFTYEFEALEPAVGIYHSHNGADQVLDGLFGAFIIGEIEVPEILVEQEGVDPTIDQEINMVLNDAGVIGLSLNGKSFPATEAYTAKVGDTLLVHYYNEGLLSHPMHLHQPLGWVIAKDGKELLVPMPGDTINIAPGERYSVLYEIVDPGVWAWHCHILTHAERADGMFGMVTALIVEE